MSILDNLRRMMLMQSGSTNREMGIMNRQNTGGLINNNQPQQFSGLFGNLANINPNLLIGASIAGSGLRGIDPFSSVLPALTETAQLQKYLTPEREKLMTAYDPKTKKNVFATRTRIEKEGLVPSPVSPELTADQKNFSAFKNIMETGTDFEKEIAPSIFTRGGKDVVSKEKFMLDGVADALKAMTINIDEVPEYQKQLESTYNTIINKISDSSSSVQILPVPESKDQLIDGQSYNVNGQSMKWNKKKDNFE